MGWSAMLGLAALVSCWGRSGAASWGQGAASPTSWTRPPHSCQNLHAVLVGLEERLRGLETVKYSAGRWDHYLEALTRRLEALDVRSRATQLKLDNLESFTKDVVSYEIKASMSAEQMERKINTYQERLMHKMNVMQTHMETTWTKLQRFVESKLVVIEKRNEEMQGTLDNTMASLSELKAQLTRLENETKTRLDQQKLSESESHFKSINKIQDMLQGIEAKVNKTVMLSDQTPGLTSKPTQIVEQVKNQVNSEALNIANKVNNMYNDLWRRVVSVESLAKDILNTANTSRGLLKDEAQFSMEDQRCTDTIENLMVIELGSLSKTLQRKMGDLNNKMDSNFQGVLASHNMLMEAWHRMQGGDQQLEDKLTIVLEKILETIVNRTEKIEGGQEQLLEMLKNHNSQVVRTVAYNSNLVKRLSEESSVEHKNLDTSLIELALMTSQLTALKQDSQDFIETTGDDQLMIPLEEGHEDFILTDQVTEVPILPDNIAFNNTLKNNSTNGVIKIISDLPKKIKINDSIEVSSNDRSRVVKSLATVANNIKNDNYTKKSSMVNTTMPQLNSLLHKRLNMSNFNISQDNKPPPTTLTQTNSDSDSNIDVNKIILLYLKELKGNFSKEKFLHEINPKKPFTSIAELIKAIKRSKHYPTDFVKELQRWHSDPTETPGENRENSDHLYDDYYTDYENY